MIDQALKLIEPEITALPWIERYSGLSRVRRRKIQVEGKSTTQSYPVSCACSASDCWNLGKYKDLVPDSKYRSVTYWEQQGDMIYSKIDGMGRKSGLRQFTGNLKLISWFNLLALGKDDCNFCLEAFTDILKLFKNKIPTKDLTDNPLMIQNLVFEVQNLNGKETSNRVFSRYTYGDIQELFEYPYDYCTIDISISFIANIDCIEYTELEDPLDCIVL